MMARTMEKTQYYSLSFVIEPHHKPTLHFAGNKLQQEQHTKLRITIFPAIQLESHRSSDDLLSLNSQYKISVRSAHGNGETILNTKSIQYPEVV